jgi:hypothetical protein
MIASDNHEQLVACHSRTCEMLTLDGSFDEAQFGHSTLHRRCDLRGVADRKADLDLRINSSESDQVPREPIPSDRLARLNGKRTALQVAVFAQRELSRFGLCQYGSRFYQEDLAGLGELDPPPDPIEQFGVVAGL